MRLIGKFSTMAKSLTIRLKQKYLPILLARDGGSKCFYCDGIIGLRNKIFEHLNNNRNDNRIENTVLACQPCNNKKRYSRLMQIKGLKKLNENEKSNFMRERNLEDEINSHEASTEIEINVSNFDITEQYISDIVNCDGYIGYSDALNSCVALCKEKTGHGSQQSVRNYLAALTSTLGCFEITRDENRKKIILRRKGR